MKYSTVYIFIVVVNLLSISEINKDISILFFILARFILSHKQATTRPRDTPIPKKGFKLVIIMKTSLDSEFRNFTAMEYDNHFTTTTDNRQSHLSEVMYYWHPASSSNILSEAIICSNYNCVQSDQSQSEGTVVCFF